MDKKTAIKTIYDTAFSADRSWNDWFFDNVYLDEEALLLAPEGNPASCMFVQQYGFLYHGTILPTAYISGAATLPAARRKGYMSQLLTEAISLAYNRGDVFMSLIPATHRLYFFYDKFGFATVVYVDIERYTSLHIFPMTAGYREVEPTYPDFNRLQLQRSATIVHTQRDFENIIADNHHDGGEVTAIADSEGTVRAMAFATENKNEIHVHELLGDDINARDMALGAVQSKLGEKPMAVYCAPTGRKAMLRARGMMRIVNVLAALTSLARSHRGIDQVIRVRDSLVAQNNGYFIISKGECRHAESTTKRVTLDVSVENLTKILFSSSRIGSIFDLPTSHAVLPLMLD